MKEHNIWGSWAFYENFSHPKQKVRRKCGALQAVVTVFMANRAIRELPRSTNLTLRINCIAKSQRCGASIKGGWGEHGNWERTAIKTKS